MKRNKHKYDQIFQLLTLSNISAKLNVDGVDSLESFPIPSSFREAALWDGGIFLLTRGYLSFSKSLI